MAKKKKKATKTRGTRRKASPAAPTESGRATEIVFSYAEIDFLRKITKRDFDATSPRDRQARLSLRDKLLDINIGRQAMDGGGLIILGLTRPEAGFLQHITKEVYSFITAEERRARLILREKILIAVEKLTGKKIRIPEPSD